MTKPRAKAPCSNDIPDPGRRPIVPARDLEPAKDQPRPEVHSWGVRAGYPLGKTGEQYHRCSGESEAEEAGYYFVAHPTGAYCEKIR